MVRCDDLELLLIDAETKQPLPEKVDRHGQTWVQGEPGNEFFVQVIHSLPPFTHVQANVQVDGKDLGYTWITQGPNASDLLGPNKDDDTVHSFKFVRHEASYEGTEADLVMPSVGTVKAIWSTVYKTAKTWDDDGSGLSHWTALDDNHHANAHNKKDWAALKAGVGSAPQHIAPMSDRVYEDGPLIGSLTIHYTTDFGMAVRGLVDEEEANLPPIKKAKKEDKKPSGTSQEDAILLE